MIKNLKNKLYIININKWKIEYIKQLFVDLGIF